jgi:hypothetical protein
MGTKPFTTDMTMNHTTNHASTNDRTARLILESHSHTQFIDRLL